MVRPQSDPFFREVISLIRAIPRGRVATYGQIASLAGDPRGARQVVRALHACSDKEGLPWHRVINSRGAISLPPGRGGREQMRRLRAEGLAIDPQGRLDLDAYQWDKGEKRPGRGRQTFLGLDLQELRNRQKSGPSKHVPPLR